MRFDFGGTQSAPEVFIAPGDYGTSGSCIGCHTLSRDGAKIAASQNGQGGGQLVYVNDIGKPTMPPAPARSDPAYLTQNGDATDHIEFASFNPTGDQFVAVYGDSDNAGTALADGGRALDRNKLWFHDGTTGARVAGAERLLPFEPDHPAWSPDGTMIAMTHVGAHGTSQREYSGGIDVALFSGSVLGNPIVVVPSLVPGTNSYNPTFVPDSSFLLFSQTTCPVGQEMSDACDSDVANNLDATTWAVRPVAGAVPVHLDRAGQPGLADSGRTPMDTFPRSTPFKTAQGSGVLFWFTVASQRQPGLRNRTSATQQLLWMFAVDPALVLAGKDGSYPGFFLPFQDLGTSNHIAEWTQKIVSATPPPAPPTPPPPPAAPPPPPPLVQ
ncbi:MAG: PD40 domain-containing protein [Myxococcales bacterium]|nr:PD40 domain-containing protein [Myxococcales bacterium]